MTNNTTNDFAARNTQAKARQLRDAFTQIADMVRAGDLTPEAANEWRVELEDRHAT